MKKLFYLFVYLFSAMFIFATESFSAEGEDTPVKGVFLKNSYGPKSQIRIDDSILDDNGVRSKKFTMSVRVWIDNVSQDQLNYSNIPLFGINLTDMYGTTTMADIVIDLGFYNVKANKNKYSTAVPGDQHNKVSARINEWVWLVLVVNDEEGWAKLYCDGEESSNLDYSSNGRIFREGEKAVFHCSNSMGYSSLPIKFDDLKITDKALTAEEISDLAFAYKQGNVPSNIKGYYSFDENTGTINEYPNLADDNFIAQVVEGNADSFSGTYSDIKLSTTDVMCDGWSPVYQDKINYTVNVTVEGEGTVTLKDIEGNEYQSGSTFIKDSTVFVVAEPAKDYILSEIYIDNIKQSEIDNVSFKITKNTEIKVIFVLKGALVNIADKALEGGTYICIDPETKNEYPKDATNQYYSIPYNAKVEVKTTAEEGYKVKSISIVCKDNTKELELNNPVFTIEEDSYEIKVVFIAQFSLNYRVENEGGTITVKVNGQNAVSGKLYDSGTEIEITANPDKGKEIAELIINNNPVEIKDNTYKTVLDKDIDIVAKFTDVTGIDNLKSTKAYYDAQNGIFHAGGLSIIKVYSLNGILLKEVVDSIIDMHTINAVECIIVINKNGKLESFKIIK